MNLEKGSASFYVQEQGPMMVIKYRANKDKLGGKQKVVFMLSTFHQPIMEPVTPGLKT